jgi:AraC family transcriptional regulator
MRSSTPILPYRRDPLSRDLSGFSVVLLPAQPYEAAYVPDRHILGFTLERQEGVDAFGCDVRRPFRAEPWRLAFTPAGCDVFSTSHRGGEYLVLSVVPQFLDAKLTTSRLGEAARFTSVMAPEFTSVALRLRRMILGGGTGSGELAIEEAGVEAIDLAAARLGARGPAKTGLGPKRLRRILDYIEVHLAREVRLRDLAQELRLSEPYLARAFKAATGTTLHRTLMERRIAHARLLMSQTDSRRWGLARIAAEAGFASHAHLAMAFRRVLGLTPSEWRSLAAGLLWSRSRAAGGRSP